MTVITGFGRDYWVDGGYVYKSDMVYRVDWVNMVDGVYRVHRVDGVA